MTVAGVLGAVACLAASGVMAQQAPQSYRFSAAELPPPSAPAPNPPKVVPRPEGASLQVPAGFEVALFAQGFKRPRWVVEAPDGSVFVSDSTVGSVYRLHDANRNRTIEDGERSEYASGLKQPFGMAFHRDALYVANTDAIVRLPYAKGKTQAGGSAAKVIDLPSGPAGHWTRNLRLSPDRSWLYVTVGSSSNVDPDPDPLRATVMRLRLDGTGREVLATGVRNAIGLDFHPRTKEPWMAVQERDGLGDELVPDFVARVKRGAFYGWPYAYIGPHEEPRRKGERPDLVKTTVTPEVLLQSHSAVMALVFYDGKAFPAKYRHGAFAALRGSSNRAKRTGYKVIFLPFANGQATGGYEDFLTGWMLGEDRPEVWGRPVGLAVLRDGSLLVTDDANGTIWRVSYRSRK